jgi:hypothetical protein
MVAVADGLADGISWLASSLGWLASGETMPFAILERWDMWDDDMALSVFVESVLRRVCRFCALSCRDSEAAER